MRPTRITARDFKCFQYLNLDLTNLWGKNVLIVGENRDEAGANSNYAGKSSFLKLFPWTFFGTRFIDDTTTEIARHGTEGCEVSIYFDDGSQITRKLRGKTQTFDFICQGHKEESNLDSQDQFFKALGCDLSSGVLRTIVNNGIYLNNKVNTLIDATPSNRLSILTDWFKLDKFDTAIEEVRERRKGLVYKVEELEGIVNEEIEDKEAIEEELKKSREDIATKEKTIGVLREKQKAFDQQSLLKGQISGLERVIILNKEHNTHIQEARKKLEELELNKLKVSVDKLKAEAEKWREEKRKLQEAETKLLNEISSLTKQELKCPECGTFLTYADLKLHKYDKETVEASIKEKKEQLLPLRQKLEGVDGELTITEDAFLFTSNQTAQVEAIKVTAEQELKDTEKEEKSLENIRTQLKDVQDYSQDIKDAEHIISILQTGAGSLEERLRNLNDLEKKKAKAKTQLTKKKEEKRLCEMWAGSGRRVGLFHELKTLTFTKIIDNLELMTNNTLQNDLNVASKIRIKATSSGIELYQGDYHPTSTLTGGETARIAIAMALSLNKLYKINLDLLLLDEFMALMDQSGVEQTLQLLKGINGIKFIVSNREIECDETILLIKQEGVTTIA